MNAGRSVALRRFVRLLLGPCVFAAALLMLPADHAGATSFSPSWNITVPDAAPGASSALVFDLNLPAPGAQFQNLVAFIPPEFSITNGDDITNGAVSGHVTSVARVGLINGACNSNVIVGIDLMDASTDPEFSTYLYDGVYDYDHNGLPDNVDYYPSTLSSLAPGTVPIQRLYGQIPVAGTLVPLNLVIFAPGTPIPLMPEFDSSLGFPTVTMLGDPFATPYPDDPISDFCTPLSATTTLEGITKDHTGLPGNQAGQVLRTNPAESGRFNSIIFARSRWDADNDGIDNGIDPCPLTYDPAWDPRSDGPSGDADIDGLPDSCDPNDAQHNTDQDGDAFLNRADLCPTVASQYYNNPDQDRDGIGNPCDPFPGDDSNNGAAHRHALCVNDEFTIGGATGDAPEWACPSGPDLPVLPRLLIYPSPAVEAVGGVHSVYVDASHANLGGSAVGVTMSFQVSGANPVTGSCLTNNGGECQFNFAGPNLGLDTITASATIDGYEVSDTATNLWVPEAPNDAFADAMPAGSLPFEDSQFPITAEVEPGEPAPCGPVSNTTWYSFTPAADVLITVEAETKGGPVSLAAYTGAALDNLALLQCDSSYYGPLATGPLGSGPPPSPEYQFEEYLAFKAEADTPYFFQTSFQYGWYGWPEVEFSIHESMMGDVNCSDTLNSIDALGVLRVSANLFPKPPCAGNGDINCNGFINSIDALIILRASAALIPPPTTCPN